MRAAIAISVLFVIIMAAMLGCTNRQDTMGATQNPEPEGNQTNPEEPAPYPLPNTSNLSFTRNVSDVVNTDTEFFKRPEFDFSKITNESGALIVYYFYTPHCAACTALNPEIEKLEADYQDVEWHEYDITSQNGTYAYQDFVNQTHLNQSQRMVPQVLVNGTVITDRFNINRTLEGIITQFSEGQS
ncbi:MAG: thioredoxin family protein [Candidatus Micrarchaeota archaeon]